MHVTGVAEEEEKRGPIKRIRNKGQTFTNLLEKKNQFTVLRSLTNPKQEEYKENHT